MQLCPETPANGVPRHHRAELTGVEPVTPYLQSGERGSWSIVGANKLRIGVLGTARSRIYCCSFCCRFAGCQPPCPAFQSRQPPVQGVSRRLITSLCG